jgi:hypothetical protein
MQLQAASWQGRQPAAAAPCGSRPHGCRRAWRRCTAAAGPGAAAGAHPLLLLLLLLVRVRRQKEGGRGAVGEPQDAVVAALLPCRLQRLQGRRPVGRHLGIPCG